MRKKMTDDETARCVSRAVWEMTKLADAQGPLPPDRPDGIDMLSAASVEDLLRINEVGIKAAQAIVDFFARGDTKKTLAGLRKAGVRMTYKPGD